MPDIARSKWKILGTKGDESSHRAASRLLHRRAPCKNTHLRSHRDPRVGGCYIRNYQIFIKLTKSKHRDMFIAHVTPTHGSKLIHRSNTIFTIVAVLSSEKQRKTAAEQRTFCCFLGRRIARKLGFLPNTTPRSL